MSNARKPRPAGPAGAKVLISRGRYAIYQTPGGDGVLSYRPDGEDADLHQVVPARFWSVLLGILSGEVKDLSPVQMIKMVMGGKD